MRSQRIYLPHVDRALFYVCAQTWGLQQPLVPVGWVPWSREAATFSGDWSRALRAHPGAPHPTQFCDHLAHIKQPWHGQDYALWSSSSFAYRNHWVAGTNVPRIQVAQGRAGGPQAGSEALKATPLSWCAKWGLDPEVRTILGHHSTCKTSAECYARDNLAKPMRDFDLVLQQTRTRTFLPDSTRSGMIGISAIEDPS